MKGILHYRNDNVVSTDDTGSDFRPFKDSGVKGISRNHSDDDVNDSGICYNNNYVISNSNMIDYSPPYNNNSNGNPIKANIYNVHKIIEANDHNNDHMIKMIDHVSLVLYSLIFNLGVSSEPPDINNDSNVDDSHHVIML